MRNFSFVIWKFSNRYEKVVSLNVPSIEVNLNEKYILLDTEIGNFVIVEYFYYQNVPINYIFFIFILNIIIITAVICLYV